MIEPNDPIWRFKVGQQVFLEFVTDLPFSEGSITWSITGTLPSGLSFSSSLGRIFGTVDTLGVSNITLQAQNDAGTQTLDIQFQVREKFCTKKSDDSAKSKLGITVCSPKGNGVDSNRAYKTVDFAEQFDQRIKDRFDDNKYYQKKVE